MKLLAGAVTLIALGSMALADSITYSSTGGSGILTGYITSVTSDFQGPVDYDVDYDSDGLFGPAGSTEAGEPVTITYSYTFDLVSGPEFGDEYIMQYEGNGVWVGGRGTVEISLDIGGVMWAYGGDFTSGGNTVTGVDQNGLPTGPLSLYNVEDGCSQGYLHLQDLVAACFSTAQLDFDFDSGGSITIDPIAGYVPAGGINPVPVPLPPHSTSESFAFTTSPEPPAFVLTAFGLCTLGLLRGRPTINRWPFNGNSDRY